MSGEFKVGDHILMDANSEGVLAFRKQEQNVGELVTT